ncbi:hypothetical protein LX12_001292 [Williamsia serinedens]|uniref:Uncharacterized protein n=1 Tax=Williamsia serinedens TaxID=391736 RepID=A0ABT1H0Q4_9NOCA|nr:hypothetical protein [Williamsia serinedens]
MCGGCGGGPQDRVAAQVQGPRRRRQIASRLTALLLRDTVRAVTAGWVVQGVTGQGTVCRTYDDLVAVVAASSGHTPAEIHAAGLHVDDPAFTDSAPTLTP